jgi:molybdenum cofactor cytidylyltransferase
MEKGIAAIILAAGYSSRMGEFKPLLPFGDVTVIERVIGLFRDAGISDIRVVIGHRATELLPLLRNADVQPVLNERYREGMFTSVVAGVGGLNDLQGGFFLLPVDIPLVRLQTVLTLLESFQDRKRNILYPVFGGRRGHPPLISAEYRGRIIAWSGQGGLKSFLAQYELEAGEVEVADTYILEDMDTPDDYRRLLGMWRRGTVPTPEECELLLINRFAADRRLLDHSREVARLAVILAGELNKAGCGIDLQLTAAAALLHDLAKGKTGHAAEGASILAGIGYPEVAKIVAVHMDISVQPRQPIGAGEVIYLADKMMQGDRLVPVQERFAERIKRHADDPEQNRAVAGRLANALLIRQRLETRLGRPLWELLACNGFITPMTDQK